MSRYKSLFERLRPRHEGAFGGFVMLGDPDIETSATLLDALVEGGADLVEVGIPFSDPIADGPVIQAAAARALKAGVRVDDCFDLIGGFRQRHPDTPLGILTYANLLAARGREQFIKDAAAAGSDSILIADVPSLEVEPYAEIARDAGIDLVMIAAPNTSAAVIERIAELSSGYTYCIARAGVTGTRDRLSLNHGRLFSSLAKSGAPPPVLGFGISKPEHVQQALAAGAAGVIAGSVIVRRIAEGGPAMVADARDHVSTLKFASNAAVSSASRH